MYLLSFFVLFYKNMHVYFMHTFSFGLVFKVIVCALISRVRSWLEYRRNDIGVKIMYEWNIVLHHGRIRRTC